MRRRPFATALVGWTLFVWTTRIFNIWGDDGLDTGEKLGRTGLALSFTLVAVAVAVTVWWGPARRASLVAVGALAGWSAAVWVVRATRILVADHEAGFKAVHTVLAVVSIVLAALAWREARAVSEAEGAARGAGAADGAAGAAVPRPPAPSPR